MKLNHLLTEEAVFLAHSVVVLFELLEHNHDLFEFVRHGKVTVWLNCNELEGVKDLECIRKEANVFKNVYSQNLC